MSNALKIASAMGASSVPVDSNFTNVSLLLHGNGTNGGQNNTFVDSSTNNFTVTRTGNVPQGTLSPFGTKWSSYFDGASDSLTAPTSTAFAFSADFTIECWVYPQDAGVSQRCIFDSRTSNASGQGVFLREQGTGFLFGKASSAIITTTGNRTVNQWQHVAVVRSGSTITLYVNGVSGGSATDASNFSDGLCRISGFIDTIGDPYAYKGYISNLRVVKGTAVYTSAFTPPSSPLSVITNTSLLTCQSNIFKDNSSNNFTITKTGDVAVSKESPFGADDAVGGSGYFDGSDYLSLPSSSVYAASGVFTFECWFYPNSFNQNAGESPCIFIATTSGGIQVGRTDSGQGNVWGLAANNIAWRLTTATLPTVSAWNHIAVTRNSGNTTSIFLNGVRVATGTVTDGFVTSAATVGSKNGVAGSFIDGYLSNLRFVNGTAVYDPTLTTLTVPTAPLTAITNTGLLLNFENASIVDSSRKVNFETVGNAQLSTTVSKFGTASLAFDGAGDYIVAPTNLSLNITAAKFTIEFFVYLNAAAVTQVLVAQDNDNTDNQGYQLRVMTDRTVQFIWWTGSLRSTAQSVVTTATISLTTWTHVAVTYDGTNVRTFIDGTLAATSASTTMYAVNLPTTIGSVMPTFGTSNYLNGYIDDLRITKGVARCIANFTPPTAAFPDA